MSHWIIPGLLGPLPRGSDLRELARLPTLERLIACARQGDGPNGVVEALHQAFDMSWQKGQHIATAPLCYLADTGKTPDRWLCLAHPVVFQPDQDRILLFAPEEDALNQRDLHELSKRFNDHFSTDGLDLVCPGGPRCYLTSDHHHAATFYELDVALGRNIDPLLPSGPDKGFWCSLLNETQMLFHDLSSNDQRLERGLPPIGGLWFSGGGWLPSFPETRLTHAAGTDPVLLGLCRVTGVELCDRDVAIARDGLILVDSLSAALNAADQPRWFNELSHLEAIFAAQGKSALTIAPCDGRTFHFVPSWRNLLRGRASLLRYLTQR